MCYFIDERRIGTDSALHTVKKCVLCLITLTADIMMATPIHVAPNQQDSSGLEKATLTFLCTFQAVTMATPSEREVTSWPAPKSEVS